MGQGRGALVVIDLEVKSRLEDFRATASKWNVGLFVDVGSTFTKVAVVQRPGTFVAGAQSRTTIETDVVVGVASAIRNLPIDLQGPFDWAMACSSAAGGLRMASVGLTHALSGQAGSLAALGAGAKVVAAESGYLDDEAIKRIVAADPHLILLSGGTDGGNEEALLFNAGMLASISDLPGVIVAGNSSVAKEAAQLFRSGKRDVRVAANVFPMPGQIAIADTRDAVRELFMQHITRAKGLDSLMNVLKAECEPTPLAVSRALWDMPAAPNESVVVLDMGGATTDVHSVGASQQANQRLVDLPVPEIMRTVEGDLGMRWGAPGIAQAIGADALSELGLDRDVLSEGAAKRHQDIGMVPISEHDRRMEEALARAGAAIAMERHAGRVTVRQQPWGDRYRVTGKDLRDCRILFAAGGVFRHLPDPVAVIRGALSLAEGSLVPENPHIVVDYDYRLYAIGLAARIDRTLSTELSKGLTEMSDSMPRRRTT